MNNENNIYKLEVVGEDEKNYIFRLPAKLTQLALSKDGRYILIRFFEGSSLK